MSDNEYLARSIHDLTAAAWFGGSLMGAIGVNGAAAAAQLPQERTRLSNIGWKKWAPVQTAALLAHGVAGAALIYQNKGRLAGQEGVTRNTVSKAAVTVVGAGLTLYSRVVGKKVEALAHEGAEGATEPRAGASPELASAQKQLKVLQWVIPAMAGTVIVLGAKHGEMQRPRNILQGLLKK
ncbi:MULTISPECIES: hypothetical protein [Kocuria]|jgi:uncharacterized membrane protein|uniref:hypothetical protein n=1 Tax=Kocuria TaxID=57493 RepID=UPI0020414A06|nr:MULTISPECIES: hypothetical protein [Kocuria]MCM3687800.1 hypothetical protein [Kocuria rosea]HST73659.1 hypothetical protein [Kocuria rosea]